MEGLWWMERERRTLEKMQKKKLNAEQKLKYIHIQCINIHFIAQ